MGNIVSYFRARPGQAPAVEQTMLAREITEETREKQDDPDSILQHEVVEIKLEEVEEALENIDDFAVIHKDSECNNGDNVDEGNYSQTEEISCLTEVEIPCKIESIQTDEENAEPGPESYFEATMIVEDDIPETMTERSKPEQAELPLPISDTSSIEAINEEVDKVVGEFDVIQETKILDTERNNSETVVEVNDAQEETISCTSAQADSIPQTASLQQNMGISVPKEEVSGIQTKLHYEEAQYDTSKTCSESVDLLVHTDMNGSSKDLDRKSMGQKTLQEKDIDKESLEDRETLHKPVDSRETVHETEEDMGTVQETTPFKEQAQWVTDNTDIESVGSIHNLDADSIDQVSNANEIGQLRIGNLEMGNSVQIIVQEKVTLQETEEEMKTVQETEKDIKTAQVTVEDNEKVPEIEQDNGTVEDKKRDLEKDKTTVHENLKYKEAAQEIVEYEGTAEDKKMVTAIDHMKEQVAVEEKETIEDTETAKETVEDKYTEQDPLEENETIQERTAPEYKETAEDIVIVQEIELDEEKVRETTPVKQVKLSTDITDLESNGSVEDSEVDLIEQDSNGNENGQVIIDNLAMTNAGSIMVIDEVIIKADDKQDAEVDNMFSAGAVVLKNILADSASFENKSV